MPNKTETGRDHDDLEMTGPGTGPGDDIKKGLNMIHTIAYEEVGLALDDTQYRTGVWSGEFDCSGDGQIVRIRVEARRPINHGWERHLITLADGTWLWKRLADELGETYGPEIDAALEAAGDGGHWTGCMALNSNAGRTL
jgi:hypothetical protein